MASWSFIVTLTITVIRPELIVVISTKLFLIFVLWFMVSDRKVRQRLQFHKIRGVSNLRFFFTIFLFDSLFTTAFILLVKGFI